jgi:hypothetical protein
MIAPNGNVATTAAGVAPDGGNVSAMPQCIRDILAGCCGSFDCTELIIAGELCVTLASDCAAFDGYRQTANLFSIDTCKVWRTLSGFDIGCDNGATWNFSDIRIVCGQGTGDCIPVGSPLTSTVKIFGGTQDDPAASPGPGSSWWLATEVDGLDTDLPVTWISASPPIGIATGYLVYDDDPLVTCPCPSGVRVDVLITDGACA